MSDFDTEVTVPGSILPADQTSAGVVERRAGRYVSTRMLRIDEQILKMLLQFKYARALHVSGWLGASGSYALKRLRFLRSMGFVERELYPLRVRDWEDQSRVSDRNVSVWRVTQKGRSVLGDGWTVVGEDERYPVMLKASKFTKGMADHSLGVVDLGVQYRRWGCDIATEREVKALEMPQRVEPTVKSPVWCPPVLRTRHAPDLCVVDAAQTRWGVELELSSKYESEYRRIVGAYLSHGLNQVWHVGPDNATVNILPAARAVGLETDEYPYGTGSLFTDADARFRLVRWSAGFSDPKNMSEWPKVWDRLDGGVVPGYVGGADAPLDLSASWRMER